MKTPKQDLISIWHGISYLVILLFLIVGWPFKWIFKKIAKDDWFFAFLIFLLFLLYHYWFRLLLIVGSLGFGVYWLFWV